ncbi:hypothetical protein LXL04_025296 [Taraxacum kok-saghyz]
MDIWTAYRVMYISNAGVLDIDLQTRYYHSVLVGGGGKGELEREAIADRQGFLIHFNILECHWKLKDVAVGALWRARWEFDEGEGQREDEGEGELGGCGLATFSKKEGEGESELFPPALHYKLRNYSFSSSDTNYNIVVNPNTVDVKVNDFNILEIYFRKLFDIIRIIASESSMFRRASIPKAARYGSTMASRIPPGTCSTPFWPREHRPTSLPRCSALERQRPRTRRWLDFLRGSAHSTAILASNRLIFATARSFDRI